MKCFHILDNYNADIMHDLAEGVIPFVLKNIFKFCIDNSWFTEEELRNNALTHDYGILNSKNIPTALHIEKHNLKQNSSQMKCLLHNVPYILYKYKDDPRITKVWPNVKSILEIVRIAYAYYSGGGSSRAHEYYAFRNASQDFHQICTPFQ